MPTFTTGHTLCMTAWGHVLSRPLIMSLVLCSAFYSKDAVLWPAPVHTTLFSSNHVTSLEVQAILWCTAL